jgi:hypothetical protein
MPGGLFAWAGLSFIGKYSIAIHLSESLKLFLKEKRYVVNKI